LIYPEYSRKLILTTDASNEGVGAVLYKGEIGKDIDIDILFTATGLIVGGSSTLHTSHKQYTEHNETEYTEYYIYNNNT
jgi:hypothetical protein